MVAYFGGRGALRLIAMLFMLVFAGMVNRAVASGPLTAPVCIARAEAGETPAMMFAQAKRFDCATPQPQLGHGDFWARVSIVSEAPPVGEHLVLRLVSMWQHSSSVFIRYADGHISRQDYTAREAGRFLTVGAVFEIPVPWRTAPVTDVLIRVNKTPNVRGIVLGPQLMTSGESAVIKGRWTALYAGFAALGFTLIVYNLALWAALRHRFLIHYCGMVAAMLCHVSSTSGAMIFVFPGLHNVARMEAGYVSLAVTAIMAMIFFAAFFESRVVTPAIWRAVRAATGFLAATTIASMVMAEMRIMPFIGVYYAGYLPGLIIVPLILTSAIRRKSSYVGIFLLAWFAPIASSVVRWLHGIGWLPYSFWIDNSSLIAFGIEALISSTAISMRIRTLSRERDIAKAEENAARELAHLDPLTGLANRRGLLAAALGRAKPQTLLLLDIDHFKRVNDTHGHERGDEVLRQFALTLRKWCPAEALVARVGGEEFVVLLPGQDDQTAIVRSLLPAIRAATMPGGLRVTASCGHSRGPMADEADWQWLYRQADAALYRAKSDGRDRLCIATDFARAA